MKKLASLLALCIAAAIGPASACTLGLGPSFPELLKSERSVIVFQLQTLAVTGAGPDYDMAAGRIRVLRTLKGPPVHFRFLRIPIGSCGLHMQVGEAYVLATSQDGELLELFPRGESILGLGPYYRAAASDAQNDRRRPFSEIRKILKGGPASDDFPSMQDRWDSPMMRPLAPPPSPPPPPAQIPPKRR